LITVELTDPELCRKKMDSKESKNDPEFGGAVQQASKTSEPEEASKTENTERAAVAEHRATVISHLNNNDPNAAFQALMTDHNGRQLSYGESRMMYG
tara:strand:- start:2208 stop:2498 length:291 start_codon:yes stop_codon:yes gene_type:complete